jgi:predicted esterase YcpF (UPF0227 family)
MLYFIHGYKSSPQGEKATLLKKTLKVIPISYRDGLPEDLVIVKALDHISDAIQNDKKIVLIGSSLGGFLAASTALSHQCVRKLILINPAIIPPDVDLGTIQRVPLRLLKEMRDSRLFEQKIPASITILRSTRDDTVPDYWIQRFASAQNATIQLYDDDHRFTRNMKRLPGIITDVLEKDLQPY